MLSVCVSPGTLTAICIIKSPGKFEYRDLAGKSSSKDKHKLGSLEKLKEDFLKLPVQVRITVSVNSHQLCRVADVLMFEKNREKSIISIIL